eukprot:m.297443 g.297443  ORF g.297443 m.297443 type:complete len:672 (+) comp13612_c0_seq1:58-2073(+)
MPPGAVTAQSIADMVTFFASTNPHTVRSDAKLQLCQEMCIALFKRDYHVAIVPNEEGQLCPNYPLGLIIPVSEKTADEPPVNHAEHLAELFEAGRFARTRQRFPVPVILHQRQNICRSATLSRKVEIVGREGTAKMSELFGGKRTSKIIQCPEVEALEATTTTTSSTVQPSRRTSTSTDDSETVTAKHRQLDVDLLHGLGIKYICDLMVEERKIKYFLTLTSSEKVDTKGRYNHFNLAVVPYPGVEWFKTFRDKQYNPTSVAFDWNSQEVNAKLKLPTTPSKLGIAWEDYKTWDLKILTQNYLRLFLEYLRCPSNNKEDGMLVHCISGWDRTPLFISLLRLSLWADGEVHQSLSAMEILYLTIAYDWLLFGHLLHDRLQKGEEIFFFCFEFLRYITDETYGPQAEAGDKSSEPSTAGETPSASTCDTPLVGGSPEPSEERDEVDDVDKVELADAVAAGAVNIPPRPSSGRSIERDMSFEEIENPIDVLLNMADDEADEYDSDHVGDSDSETSSQAEESDGEGDDVEDQFPLRAKPGSIPLRNLSVSSHGSPGACHPGNSSPIGIPGQGPRCDSTPELSSSWQVVSDMGSMSSPREAGRPNSGRHGRSRLGSSASAKKCAYEHLDRLNFEDASTMRERRLLEVRALFLPMYAKCMGSRQTTWWETFFGGNRT